jgi:DmsE family decaheme c-type cytochrome
MNRFLIRLFRTGVAALALTGFSAWAAETPLPELSTNAGAQAVAEALKADAVCTKCHDESESKPVLSIAQTRHGVKADMRTPTCQSCHGKSDKHLAGGKGSGNASRPAPDIVFHGKLGLFPTTDPTVQNETCIGCHKGGKRLHWGGSQHQGTNVACADCHQSHVKADPVLAKSTQTAVCFTCHKTERAQAHRVSTHPLQAGKMGCSDCHNPHGSTGPKLMVKNTVNETCFTCHTEKRGPFLWEHPPATDDCMSCHTPHGSTNAPLLRARSPFLCQQCHGDGAPHPGNLYSGAGLPGGAVANVNATGGVSGTTVIGANNPLTGAKVTQNNPAIQLSMRGCANCHSQIHGSNHPAGNRFLR